MACMLVLWITVPLLTLALSLVPLAVYFYMTHRVRGTVSHPYRDGMMIGLLCAVALASYLILRSTAEEKLAAYGISLATMVGFINAGAVTALFYRRSRSRLACRLFPGRPIAAAAPEQPRQMN
ncbi:MAG: hypothetical protein M0033_04275 [Nitrospiraceae bacterium]|nr:hypothetical protein [Nitrospiraceae bacterium]MDA8325414.1 hypothetical protein [Nitrospiraceae bacterium]